MENLYQRVAKLEAYAAMQKMDFMGTLKQAYENACTLKNEEDAAVLARRIRNKLLENSDSQMALDRINIDAKSADILIESILNNLQGEWAAYRQELRDLPQQEGFPFNVNFPEPPTGK